MYHIHQFLVAAGRTDRTDMLSGHSAMDSSSQVLVDACTSVSDRLKARKRKKTEHRSNWCRCTITNWRCQHLFFRMITKQAQYHYYTTCVALLYSCRRKNPSRAGATTKHRSELGRTAHPLTDQIRCSWWQGRRESLSWAELSQIPILLHATARAKAKACCILRLPLPS